MEFVNLLKLVSDFLPQTVTLTIAVGYAVFFIVGKRKDWNMSDKKYLQSEIDRLTSELQWRLSEIRVLRDDNAELRQQIKSLRKELSDG